MKGAWFSLYVCGALCFAPVASGQTGGDDGGRRCSRTPAYLCFSKRELWETAERWRAKSKRANADLAKEERAHLGTLKKLGTRTSTAVAKLVVPPLPTKTEEGHSTTTLVLMGVAALAAGITLGIVSSKDNPQTVVVK